MRPSECKRERHVLGLEKSHISSGDFDMLIQHDGAVIFTEQEAGKPVTRSIIIPRRTFLRFLDWYDRDQV